MINRLHIRELLAWTAVVLALILFSATIAFSQEKTVNVTNNDGKVHVVTVTKENGKTVTKDTTFEMKDSDDIDEVIEAFVGRDKDGKKDKDKKVIHIKSKDGKKGSGNMVIDLDIPEWTEADQERLNKEIEESMSEMRHGMKELHKSLRNMKIYISDGEDFDFDFDFDPHAYAFSFSDDDFDSLRDDDHIVIIGDENETAPVLEKTVKKNGKQAFVYKRSNPVKKESASSKWVDNLKCYPNPSDGKFTISFKSPKENNLAVSVTDAKGKIVYSEKLNSFSGNY